MLILKHLAITMQVALNQNRKVIFDMYFHMLALLGKTLMVAGWTRKGISKQQPTAHSQNSEY